MRQLALFYSLAFAIAWLGWLPTLRTVTSDTSLILPGISPALAALIARRFERQPNPLRPTWSISPPWLLLAAAIPPALLACANAFTPTPAFSPQPSIAIFAILSLLANPCEEIGWRGFALTRLQSLCHPHFATLIVALLWALWHLPLFLSPAGIFSMATIPPIPWLCALIARSFVISWLFNRSNRSIPVASAFHISTNLSAAILGIHSWYLLAAVEAIAALLLASLPRPRQLS